MYYVFGCNETHSAMPLDYGSLLNHHESYNTYVQLAGKNNMYFLVRGGFSMCVT